MSKCSLFLVDEDLFFKFSSSSYSLVTGIKTKLLKRGAKDATRMARSTQEHGTEFPKPEKLKNLKKTSCLVDKAEKIRLG